jgi:acyl carrier protein
MDEKKLLPIDEKIRTYIIEKLLKNQVPIEINTSLYRDGLLNSMAHLKLISFLEKTYQISIPSNQVNLENFDSLEQISKFVNGLIHKRGNEC